MLGKSLRGIDNIETNDMNFKHLETTKDIIISPKNEYGDPQRPDATHTWTAKVSDGTNFVGDYAVKINGTSLIVDSEDFTKLPVGSYQLEVWEQWTDTDGTSQLSIYPSPKQTIPFTIYANIADQAEKEIKRIGFQDVVDQAVMNIGMNYVFKVNTIEPDQNATVVQSAADGKNYVTFNIPRGQTGEQGFRGPAGKGFHIQQTFASVKDMEASQGKGFEDGDFALIASDVNDPDNSKLYAWSDANKKFTYMDDLSGAQGIQGPAGPAPTLHVTKVTSLPSNEAPTFNLVPVSDGNYNVEVGIPKGEKGDPGPAGPQGKSAYQVWLDNGNTGNETDFLSSLKGKDGKDVDLSLYLSKEEAQKDYATKDSVKAIALDTAKRTLTIGDQVINIPDSVDLSPYAKTSDVPQVVYDADKRTLTINGTKVDLPANVDLTNYYTKPEVDQLLAKVTADGQVDLSGYLTTADANKTYQTKADASSQNSNLQTEINKKADATALADYVPTSLVDTLKGPKGDTGESAYQIWLDAGHTGTETDFINSIKGPKGDTGPAGPQGKSAYQVWLDNGNTGNETDFLSSLKGKDGKDVDLSLYLSKEEAQKDYATKDSVKAIALDTAKRTLTIGDQVINIPDSVDLSPYAKTSDVPQVVYDADKRTLTINGTKVDLPANVDLTNYYTKPEVDQLLAKVTADGQVDLSGYLTTADANKTYQTKADASSQNSNLQTEINKKADATALADYVPTSLVDTLKGPKGDTGESAYQIWLDAGHTGTETDFINSIKGPKGDTGPAGPQGLKGDTGPVGESAYQVWLDAGNTGTEAQFLASLKGPQGPAGTTPVRGTDYWTTDDQNTIKQWVENAILNGQW